MEEIKDIELLSDFQEHLPYLVGNEKQFYINQGEVYCLRNSCDGCPYIDSCTFIEEKIQTSIVPHPRAGIGPELRSFLILRLKGNLDFEKDVPKELWNHDQDHHSQDECNLHFLLSDFNKPFIVLKGQFRFYGKAEVFQKSPYSEYFSIFNEYIPNSYVVAMDLSAIEPRVVTIACREPEYIKVFEGTPKPVVREVKIEGIQ